MTPCGSWPGHPHPPPHRCGNVMDAGWLPGCHLASCHLQPLSPGPLPSSSSGSWRSHTCGSSSCHGCGNLGKLYLKQKTKNKINKSKQSYLGPSLWMFTCFTIYVWLSWGQARNPMIDMPTVLLCLPLAPNLLYIYTTRLLQNPVKYIRPKYK